MIQRTIEVEIGIVSVDVKDEEEEEEDTTPKQVVLGYSPGDEVRIAGRDHTILSVNYDRPFRRDEPTTFRVRTENGLLIEGSAADVMAIIES